MVIMYFKIGISEINLNKCPETVLCLCIYDLPRYECISGAAGVSL